MLNYIEKDAYYEIRIPADYVMEDCPTLAVSGLRMAQLDKPFSLENYRKYWDGRVVQVTEILKNAVRGPSPKVYGNNYHSNYCKFDIPKCWLFKLIKHCSQVEHYILQNMDENYVSPFTGRLT